jgi:hypothetical protein|tara:strand:+ start:85 stop:738 length:654 start_codon:yes stop_codon:yes gene_type:complete
MNSVVSEKTFITNRLNVPYENLSQSYLRAETQLTSTSQIDFQFQLNNVGGGNKIVTERLLELNDEFVITNFFIGLKQIGSDTPTDAQHLNAQIFTWDNVKVFSGTNAANVSSVYNGSLGMTINRKQFIPEFPVRAFRRVPQTQQSTLQDAATTFTGGVDQYPNGLYGFYPTDPTVINGRQTIDTSIDLGASVDFDDSSNSVFAVAILRGYLVVNAKS